jgi:hypothetical protein
MPFSNNQSGSYRKLVVTDSCVKTCDSFIRTADLLSKLLLEPAVVPKAGSVFILQADCWEVTLIGDKLSPKDKLKEDQRQQRAQSLIR